MHEHTVPNDTIDRQSAMDVPLGPVLATACWDGDAWRVADVDGISLGTLADATGRRLAADEYRQACERLRERATALYANPDAVEDVRVVDLATIRAYGPVPDNDPALCGYCGHHADAHSYGSGVPGAVPCSACPAWRCVRAMGDDSPETAAAEAAYADEQGMPAARAAYDRVLAAAEPIRPTMEQRITAEHDLAARHGTALMAYPYVVGQVTGLIRALAAREPIFDEDVQRALALLDGVDGGPTEPAPVAEPHPNAGIIAALREVADAIEATPGIPGLDDLRVGASLAHYPGGTIDVGTSIANIERAAEVLGVPIEHDTDGNGKQSWAIALSFGVPRSRYRRQPVQLDLSVVVGAHPAGGESR